MTIVTCPGCGAERDVKPAIVLGREFVGGGWCQPCLDADLAREAEAERQNLWADRRNRSQLPRDLENLQVPDGQLGAIASRWAAGEIPLLVLHGPVGVGKTHLAAAACWQAFSHRPVRWVSVARAMSQLRAAFGDDDRARALAALTGDGSVVLDDIDKVPPTDAGASMLYTAIDARIVSGRPMLITMNSDIGQLAGRMGEMGDAIASRVQAGMAVRMTGADRRLAA